MPKLTLCFKGRFIGLHNLAAGSNIIGRDVDADIHIESLAIAGRHAQITIKSEQCHISPLDDNLIRINQRPVSEETQLAHGDTIQIGKHELFFADDVIELAPRDNVHAIGDPDRKPRTADNAFDQLISSINTLPSGTIQILSGRHLGKIIPLQRGLTRLGLTGNECAVVAHRDDGYYISHLEGDVPPKVNNRSIDNRSVRLEDGCEILLGNTRMRFHEEIEQSAAI
ncbi:FHA domain-containing protein [Sedimenticola sp.]|uniref:FHA domain-containing protein n=1 Tax=Sedimenticola sp. TaxID=1940285 RepID=UPI003D0AF64F